MIQYHQIHILSVPLRATDSSRQKVYTQIRRLLEEQCDQGLRTTDSSRQKVHTQIRRLLEEHCDQGVPCLLCHLLHLEAVLCGKAIGCQNI